MGLELIGTTVVASLLGSLHCAAMCGGLVGAVCSGARTHAGRLQVAFHVGRGLAYVVLGTLAGAVGSAVNLAGQLHGMADIAGIVAGVLVLAAGLRGLLVSEGALFAVRAGAPSAGTSLGVQRWLGRHLGVPEREPLLRAGLLGVSCAVLPCGWLYAFVFAAAGSGSPAAGGVVLLAFWLGTLPALAGVGVVVRRLTSALRSHVAFLSALALVVLGLATILHRVNIPAEVLSQMNRAAVPAGADAGPPCHARTP